MAGGAGMTHAPDPARHRFAIIGLAKAGGLVLMLVGIWIMAGDPVRPGGATEIGLPIGAVGAIVSLVVPRLLVRRWRTPPKDPAGDGR